RHCRQPTPISVLKGGKALTPEESKNFSFGTVVEVDDFFATLDYFRIEVEDRISQSSSQELTPADVQALLALGVSDATSFAGVKYFTNDFDTTTQGLDFVANYSADMLGGRTTFALAANWTDTTVDKASDNINEAKIKVIEDGLPSVRGSFTINHTNGAWRGYVRLNQYGSYFEDHADSGALRVEDDGLPLNLSAAMTVDAEISYAFDENYEVSLGATNLFDKLPDENRWADVLGAKYPTTAVMGFNGGFYYARMTYNF
ncbi:MAG: TonB-dependent receptor, partial [Gammaproteobacteria bacterium]|nr:TonB-dependent receptor [Gammaproteobacteria bacterium]